MVHAFSFFQHQFRDLVFWRLASGCCIYGTRMGNKGGWEDEPETGKSLGKFYAYFRVKYLKEKKTLPVFMAQMRRSYPYTTTFPPRAQTRVSKTLPTPPTPTYLKTTKVYSENPLTLNQKPHSITPH